MSSIAQLISLLGAAGIQLWLDETQQLRFKAPKGALTAELRSQLLDNKTAVIEFLKQSQKQQPSIKAVERDAQGHSLSFSQQRFWFLDKLNPGDASLHIPAAIEINGPLNTEHLQQAFNLLIAQHEILRTFFVDQTNSNQPTQVVVSDASIYLHEDYDLSHLTAQEQTQHIQDIMRDEALSPFDLAAEPSAKAPFIRVRLARCHRLKSESSAQRFIVFICLHHIVADGTSIALLLQQLGKHYQNLQQYGRSDSTKNAIDYIDFAQWQKQWMQSDEQRAQLNFWQEQCQDLPLLQLPTDKPRPVQVSHQGASLELPLNADTSTQISALAKQLNVSEFTVYFSAFHILLSRLSGQNDFAIGTPVAGRNEPAIAQSIGCFINLLAVRNKLNGQQSFAEFCQQVQQQLLNTQQQQQLPFDVIAENCISERNQAFTPIFQTLFTLQNDSFDNILPASNLQSRLLTQQSVASKYDLQLHINNSADKSFTLEYNSDLFFADNIKNIAESFQQLLHSIATQPEKNCSQLSLLSPAQQQQLTQVLPAKAFMPLSQSANQIHQFGQKLAVSDGVNSLSFLQLDHKANALACAWQKQGLAAGSFVGLYISDKPSYVVAMLATIKLNACFVPLDTQLPEKRLTQMLQQISLDALVCQGKSIACDSPIITLSNISDLAEATNAPAITPQGDVPLYCIFTSGSTGTPKASSVSYNNGAHLLRWFSDEYQLNTKQKVLVISSIGFDLSQKNILGALLQGAELHFSPEPFYQPDSICQIIQARNITWLNCAPSAFYPLVDYCKQQQRFNYLNSLQQVFFGGEPIQTQALKPWLDSKHFNAQLVNMYGPTECTDIALSHTVNFDEFSSKLPIPMGKTINGVQCLLLDEQLQLLPLGATGELYIGGISVGLGYINNDSANQQSFIDNPYGEGKLYKTGDLVRYRFHGENALFEFVSRADQQIKIRGFRIELGEINQQLLQINGIEKAHVIAKDQQLIAYLVGQKPDAGLSALRFTLSQNLPDYMVPSAFVFITAMPLSANGKVDNKALPTASDNDFAKSEYLAPRNALEEDLAELFSQHLNIQQVGIEDDFFQLGGHSLLATALLNDINQHFGINIKLGDFFQHANIKSLSEWVNAGGHLQSLTELAAITKADRSQDIPASLAQERLWIIEQIAPGNSAYHISAGLHLKGAVNAHAFTQSIYALVNRHESLRTNFKVNSQGQVLQNIHAADFFTLDEIDLSGQSDGLNAAKQLFNTLANTPFNVLDDCLFRAQWVKINDSEYQFNFCLHHLIADGWSVALMQRDLQGFYQHFNQQLAAPSELPIHYADFAQWQRLQIAGNQQQQHLEFWLQQLQDAPPLLRLPYDKPRPAQQSFNGAIFKQQLPANALKSFSQEQGVTLFTTLISQYALLLQQYSGQQDICIGSPVAGRIHPDSKDVFGLFVNAIVLRCKLYDQPSFSQLLERVQETALAAFAHQDVAIEQILENLNLERNLSYPPIAQVGFSYIAGELSKVHTLEGVEVDYFEPDNIPAKYDLTLVVIDQGDELQLQYEYNQDLFLPETIVTLAGHFEHIIEQTIKLPNINTQQVALFSDQELQQRFALSPATTFAPLTDIQHDMLAGQLLEPETYANTLGYNVGFEGPLDTKLWQQACNLSLNHFVACRSGFALNSNVLGPVAYQYQLPSINFTLSIIDKRQAPASDEQTQQWVNDFIYQPAQYAQQNFIRCGVLLLADNRGRLLLSSHHGLLDGISVVLLARVTLSVYKALLANESTQAVLEQFDDNFNNYLVQKLSDEAPSKAWEFWQPLLADCQGLRFSGAKTTHPTQQIIRKAFLSTEHFKAIKTFCRKQRLTPALYLKTLYSFLLSQYCQSEQAFYISEYNAGRSNAFAQSIGCFFEHTPFVLGEAFLNATNISELFAQTTQQRKQQKQAAHISPAACRQLSNNHNGLQFSFNYYHFFPTGDSLNGQALDAEEMPPLLSNAVQFVIKEKLDFVQLDLYYQSDAFADFDFLSRLLHISEQVLQGQTELSAIKLLLPEEQNSPGFIGQKNNQAPSDVLNLLQQSFTQHSEKTALIDQFGSLSYQQLNLQSDQLALFYKTQGLGHHSRIVIYMARSIEAIVAITACLKIGAVYIPVDSNTPEERLKHIADLSEAELIVSQQALNMNGYNSAVFSQGFINQQSLQDYSGKLEAHQADSRDMLYIIFTSGSTGTPKGVIVDHKGENNLLHWYLRHGEFKPESRVLLMSALGFDLSQKNIFASLACGASLVLNNNPLYDSGAISQLIQQQQITHINCAPSAFYPLIEDNPQAHLLSLKFLMLGGEAIANKRLADWFNSSANHCRLFNHYGPSECTDIALYHEVQKPLTTNHSLPLGKPNHGVQVYIINSKNQLMPEGLTGELAIAGTGVGQGYVGQQALTEQQFIANPFGPGRLYKTGDLAYYQPGTGIIFNGRKDQQIKLFGQRIELGEIESALLAFEQINEVLITLDEQQLVAYYLADEAIDEQQLSQTLESQLPRYMVPTFFVPIKRWPLSLNGKIDRKRLPKIDKAAKKVPFVAPRDEVEQTLCEMIGQVLQVEQVGIHDNFFDLGGHSLAASRAIVQVREHFEIDIPLNVLFEMTTVEKLATYIKASQWAIESAQEHDDGESRDTGFI